MTTDTIIDTLETDLTKLSSAIAPIVAAHAESEAAHADKLAAQIALVTKILEIARPAVRALGTRPKISDKYVSGGGSIAEEHARWRGLILSCEPKEVGPSRKTITRSLSRTTSGRSDDAMSTATPFSTRPRMSR